MLMVPISAFAQNEGGDKEKKEKTEKPPKEKKEKKEKPEKAPKEKKAEKTEATEPIPDDKAAAPEDEPIDLEADAPAVELPPKDLIGGVDDTSRVDVPCYRYHVGYLEYIDKNYHGIKVKRTSKKEIQTNTIDGNKMVFKIEWTSDYQYQLLFLKSKLPSRFKPGYVLTCKMVDCWDEYYDCDCDLNGITQYASLHKALTKQEIKAAKERDEALIAKLEADAAKAMEDSIAKANAPKLVDDDDFVVTPKPVEQPIASPEAQAKGTPSTQGKVKEPKTKAVKEGKAPKAKKEKKAKKPKAEKPEKAPKEKKVKVPKEKKEKPPKEAKAPEE